MSGLIDKAYDPIDGAMMMKSMQKKFRESFAGVALDPAKWDVSVGAGMTVGVSGGVLSIASGITASSETIITSKETFTIPFRVLAGLYLTQRIANQEFYIEAVSVNPLSDVVDDQNYARWKLDGVSATTGTYSVKNISGTEQSLALTINSTASYNLLEIEPFADECWFHTRILDSANGRTASGVRHRDIPDPNQKYKLRIRVKNLAVAPASTTTFGLLFVACSDYMELTTEITAGRGGGTSGASLPVTLTASNAALTTYAAPSTSIGISTMANVVSTASTNATLVKAAVGVLQSTFVSNSSASWRYLKLFNKATAPVPGTDVPFAVIPVAPGSVQLVELAIGLRFTVGIAFAITALPAPLDATAVGADEVVASIGYL